MNRAFVKEPDEGEPGDVCPERPISEHANYVTPAGLRQLETRWARSRSSAWSCWPTGTTPAEEQLAYVDRDLRYYRRGSRAPSSVDPARQPRRKVAFGAAVTVSQDGGERRTFSIVGEDEADLEAGQDQPRVAAGGGADGRARRRRVLWRRPAGDMKLTVEAIDYPE